jgi:acetate kinase
MRILICNVGSTSLKYQLFEMDGESMLAKGGVERVGAPASPMRHQSAGHPELTKEIQASDHSAAVAEMLALLQDADPAVGVIGNLGEVAAVGFKVVGARGVTGAVRLDEPVLRAMEEYNPVLPAHNPPYLAAIRIFERLVPEIPRIGLFETTFHRDIPDYAWVYSVPYEWYEKYGVRRYGYHGASLRYVSERVAELAPPLLGRSAGELRLVACHLGGSSSVCAIRGGRSIDTSMGLTTQAGVPMSSRSGDFDPFVIPFIQEREGLDAAGVVRALTTNGGLKGISGVSGDARDLEEAEAAGNDRARLALDAFAYEVKKYIGAYAAAMGGLDALAFSGGIGENGVEMRRRICEGLGFLGVELDEGRNAAARRVEAVISREGAPAAVFVVPTNEEIIVARACVAVLTGREWV